MLISILTLFPSMFEGPLTQSIVKRAGEKGLVEIQLINIRDFATDEYKTVDDHPYGGGPGMLLKVDVVDRALQAARQQSTANSRTILLDPQGTKYTQAKAKELSTIDHLILVCAHYEGVDERVRSLVDEEVSIGDYVLSGGEIPAMAVADSIVRLIPGTLKDPTATTTESFTDPHTLEYPQYTRPPSFQGMDVPPVLLSGNHAEITKWRQAQARSVTKQKRPDLREESNETNQS